MKAMDLLVGFGSVKDSYVISAEEFRQGKQKAQVKCLSTRKMWLIAAVIALMLLLVGCAVVYVLHLQDMKIGEEVITQEAWTGPSGEYMPSTEWVNTQLSLQGYNGSPEQQALREWLDFKEQYDPDGTLMKENNMNESGVPEQYYITYDCYTFEMMDKLNEILDKYHLNALGTWIYFDRWETPLSTMHCSLTACAARTRMCREWPATFPRRVPSTQCSGKRWQEIRRNGSLPTPTQKIRIFTPIIPLC